MSIFIQIFFFHSHAGKETAHQTWSSNLENTSTQATQRQRTIRVREFGVDTPP